MGKFNHWFFVLAPSIIGFWLFVSATFAQTNTQIILTWQANNFYPANYEGKPLATPNSQITAAVEVLENNKLLNLERANIVWLLDDKPLSNGQGLKETGFAVKKREGDNHTLRVTIQLENRKLESLLRIPVSKKFVVIENPYPNGLIPADSEIALQAVPYFFNIASLSELSFAWQANTEKETNLGDNRLVLKFGKPIALDQNSVFVSSFVQSARNPLEFAEAKIKLTIF